MSLPDGDAADRFQPLRPGLVRLAYRMLGSIAEAEDVVQEAYIRWHQTGPRGPPFANRAPSCPRP